MQYLRTVYREYEINASVELEQKLCLCCSWGWDLKYTGLMTNLGPVPFVPWGTSRRVRRSKNIHNEKASTFHETLEVGVKDAVKDITFKNWYEREGNLDQYTFPILHRLVVFVVLNLPFSTCIFFNCKPNLLGIDSMYYSILLLFHEIEIDLIDLLRCFFLIFGGHHSFLWVTDTSVLDFW